MERKLTVAKDYLYLPICAGKPEKKLEIFLEREGEPPEKLYEFLIPLDEEAEGGYPCDFYGEIPVRHLKGRNIRIRLDAPELFPDSAHASPEPLPDHAQAASEPVRGGGNDAPGRFLDHVRIEEKRPLKGGKRPAIHFTADTGWSNDPNGLVYADGVYHFYFQYNPFNTVWNNMSWGHAVSADLLHWEQLDSVMFPDESGAMYSGCGLTNDRGLLGLPRDALLFFYTAAGGNDDWSREVEFTQKIAYSTDGGRTLVKIPEPCVPTLYRESRDPKIYWHEETKAYVMALWTKGNDFAILRSEDLRHWEKTDEFTLEEGWECPDLLRMVSEDGEEHWFFWSADGYYYPGTFDGYRFKASGQRHRAYLGKLPYAAQTYANTPGRIISVPWLRLENDGRLFTGAYGIPVELSCRKVGEGTWQRRGHECQAAQEESQQGRAPGCDAEQEETRQRRGHECQAAQGDILLVQKPVRELTEQAKSLEKSALLGRDGKFSYQGGGANKAFLAEIKADKGRREPFLWEINGSRVEYQPESGMFLVDSEKYQAGCMHREFWILVDDRILEIFFDGGIRMGAFALKEADVAFETEAASGMEYAFYEIE